MEKKKLGLLERIRKRYQGESGQSTMEYILILVLVVMIANKMKSGVIGKVNSSLNKIESQLIEFDQPVN